MAKLTVNDLSDLQGKRVFVRVDYNVPMEEKDGQMVINDVTRIKETIPTLRELISKGARIILASHLGRPKGQREPSMSLRPVAAQLAELLGRHVEFVDDCIGEKVEIAVNEVPPVEFYSWRICAITMTRRRTTPLSPRSCRSSPMFM
jgi:phosphoglycerate kinase